MTPRVADMTTSEILRRVRGALEDPRYNWRTVGGIERETGLTREAVVVSILALIDAEVALRSELKAPDGAELFTTYAHQSRITALEEGTVGAGSVSIN